MANILKFCIKCHKEKPLLGGDYVRFIGFTCLECKKKGGKE